MNRRNGPGCVSDLQLDRLLGGEFNSSQTQAYHAHLSECSPCQARFSELEQQQLAFDENPGHFARSATETSLVSGASLANKEVALNRATRWWPVVTMAAAAAALILQVGRNPTGKEVSIVEEETRRKGAGPHLGYVVQRSGRVTIGRRGVSLQAGDAVRFTVTQDRASYVVVLSRDAQGTISRYHPPTGEPSRIGPGERLPLPSAVELDDTLGAERIIGVFCQHSPNIEKLEQALRKQPATPQLPADCDQDLLLFVKRAVEPTAEY